MSNAARKTVDRALWSAQILAALLFLFAGITKFLMSPAALQQGPIALPIPFIQFIGACEILGGLGLLLPGLLHIRTGLVPLAAAGLTIIMIGAVAITVRGMGASAAIFPAVVAIVTAAIMYGRLRLVPLSNESRRGLRAAH